MIGRDHFYLRISEEDKKSEILNSFIKQYYAGTPFLPGELMLPEEIEEQELLVNGKSSFFAISSIIRFP